MSDIARNINEIRQLIPENIKLIAVSKTKTVDEILRVFETGQTLFGENKVQELAYKRPLLPAEIAWHFIGHLQKNKVRVIAPFVSLIHSIESIGLLQEVNKEGKKHNRIIPCLLQFHIAREETKFGLDYPGAIRIIESHEYRSMANVCISGVMGMATYTDDQALIRSEFRLLKGYYTKLKAEYFPSDSRFGEISMGMTSDFLIAIEEGSTMVRIGSAIFGERSGQTLIEYQ